MFLYLFSLLLTTQEDSVDSVDQDQNARNVILPNTIEKGVKPHKMKQQINVKSLYIFNCHKDHK